LEAIKSVFPNAFCEVLLVAEVGYFKKKLSHEKGARTFAEDTRKSG